MSQVTGHVLQENLARMRNQGDSPIITVISQVFFLVRYLNDGVLPQLWYLSLLPDLIPWNVTRRRELALIIRPHRLGVGNQS